VSSQPRTEFPRKKTIESRFREHPHIKHSEIWWPKREMKRKTREYKMPVGRGGPHHLYPWAFSTLPSVARTKRPRSLPGSPSPYCYSRQLVLRLLLLMFSLKLHSFYSLARMSTIKIYYYYYYFSSQSHSLINIYALIEK